jgi:hypothetical protein
LKISRPGRREERCKEEEIISRRISLRYLSAVGSGEGAQSLASGGAHRRTNLGRQILSKYPSSIRLDRSCTRFTFVNRRRNPERKVDSLGFHILGNRKSRWHEIGNFQGKLPRENIDSQLVETRGRAQGIGSQDIDIPVDRRSGKSIVKTLIKSEPSVWGDRSQKSEES